MSELAAAVGGVPLALTWYRATSRDLSGPAGRPCVILAHGFGATRDCGLDGFARRFAEAGIDAVTFDYRGFGDSGGYPRQVVDPAGQCADYRAVVSAARAAPEIDAERVAVWGVSFSGGHVLRVAAEDPRVAAVVALTPAPDGLRNVGDIVRRDGVLPGMRAAGLGVLDVAARALRRGPVLAAQTGPPGSLAALTAAGAEERYRAVAGPTWRNEVAARAFVEVPLYRPIRSAPRVRCAALVQIAEHDSTAPPAAAVAAAHRLEHGEVRHYPCDHFDVYPGQKWHDLVVDHQLRFLRRRLAPPTGGTGPSAH